MVHHYMTKYDENNHSYVESWIQINLFKRCYCLSKRIKQLSQINSKLVEIGGFKNGGVVVCNETKVNAQTAKICR